jgi:hypothetical protein
MEFLVIHYSDKYHLFLFPHHRDDTPQEYLLGQHETGGLVFWTGTSPVCAVMKASGGTGVDIVSLYWDKDTARVAMQVKTQKELPVQLSGWIIVGADMGTGRVILCKLPDRFAYLILDVM